MMHLITGGSGSGKSAYAEAQILALNGERRIYIATMYPYDEESHRRIARHREMRAKRNLQRWNVIGILRRRRCRRERMFCWNVCPT